MNTFKILDCTLRDGGYYTDWYFNPDLVKRYFLAIAESPVAQVEMGYLNPVRPGSSGPYFYLGRRDIEAARALLPADRKIAVMMNYKDVSPSIAASLMKPVRGLVDIVRFACPPAAVKECIEIAKVIREYDAEVAINVMYLSKYITNAPAIMAPLASCPDAVQYVSLVDSYGSCFPDDVSTAIAATLNMLPQQIGFHGHDNIGLAFGNALAAINAGAHMVDSTILGMGRGAGNLRTELIAAYLERGKHNVPLSAMAESVNDFETLRREYEWGTNLPYIISGFNGLPQADVMDWLGTRRYTISSIVSALQGTSEPPAVDHVELPGIAASPFAGTHTNSPMVIVGGGSTVFEHRDAIIDLAEQTDATIVLSSLRHAHLFANTKAAVVSCLAGQEAQRRQPLPPRDNRCFVVSDQPRLAGTLPGGSPCYTVSDWAKSGTRLGPVSDVAPLELALGVAIDLKASTIYLAGFDGYSNATLADQANASDVQTQIDLFAKDSTRAPLQAITPTLYRIAQVPLYGLLSKAASGV